MKNIFIMFLVLAFVFSLKYNHEDAYICVSNDSIELERSLQQCEEHYEFHSKDGKNKRLVKSLHHCDDYKINYFNSNVHFYSLKIEQIKQFYFFSNFFLTYTFKIDIKSIIKNRLFYTQLSRDYNPILIHIKSTVLRT